METLKISYKNFWVLLYKFIFMLGFKKESNLELPEDTCSFRRDLILGTLSTIVSLPFVLLYNLIVLVFPKMALTYFAKYAILYIISILTIVAYVILNENGLSKGLFIDIYGINIFIILCMAALVFFIATIVLIIMFSEYAKGKGWIKKLQIPKFTFIKEMYKSAKEKYCKKIDYV